MITRCPHCQVETVGAFGHLRSPRPGDFTVCLSCTGISRYTTSLAREAVSLGDVPHNVRGQLEDVLTTVREMRKIMPRGQPS